MNRRSFLVSLGFTGLSADISAQLKRSVTTETETSTSHWDVLDREEKMLRLAERVVPGTNPEQLIITPADVNSGASVYELDQCTKAGTRFVSWLIDSDISISLSDIAGRAYSITDEDKAGPAYPHNIDGIAIAIPSGEIDALVSAVKGWEDNARTQMNVKTTEAAIAHDRGLSRALTCPNPFGYRIQRIRILDDRMLVTWVEGMYKNRESCLPLVLAKRIEQEILLRRVRMYLNAGNSIPDEPITLEKSRWRK